MSFSSQKNYPIFHFMHQILISPIFFISKKLSELQSVYFFTIFKDNHLVFWGIHQELKNEKINKNFFIPFVKVGELIKLVFFDLFLSKIKTYELLVDGRGHAIALGGEQIGVERMLSEKLFGGVDREDFILHFDLKFMTVAATLPHSDLYNYIEDKDKELRLIQLQQIQQNIELIKMEQTTRYCSTITQFFNQNHLKTTSNSYSTIPHNDEFLCSKYFPHLQQFQVLQYKMESIQRTFLPSLDSSSEQQSVYSIDSKQLHSVLPFQHKYPEPLMSPCFGPTQFQPISPNFPPLLKNNFKLVDEENIFSNESENDLSSDLQLLECISKVKPLKSQRRQYSVERSRTNKHKNNENKKISKNIKGLRVLSENVYQIAMQLKVTSYKQVADKLISKFTEENRQGLMDFKDQKNIKRRVYDALNVLVAAGILKKDGKQVICNHRNSSKNKKQEQEKAKESLNDIKEDIQQKKTAIQEKRERIQQLRKKQGAIKDLIQRNKRAQNHENKLNFPLIGLIKEKGLKVKRWKKCLRLKMDQPETIEGDVDMIVRLNEMEEDKESVSNYLS